MPVDVPRCFWHADAVDITDQQRADLAAQVQSERVRQFGAKSAAYNAAGLNAATWDRIESGARVRDDRLIAAVKVLWPSSGGDWQKIASEPIEELSLGQRMSDLENRVDALERASRAQREDVMGNAKHPAPMNEADDESAPDPKIEEVNGDTFGLSELDAQRETQAGQGRHGDLPG